MPAIDLYARDAMARRPTKRLMTVKEWCERDEISTVTAWRIMKSGDGPKVTQISPRRIGIRECDYVAWLNRRLAAPVGKPRRAAKTAAA